MSARVDSAAGSGRVVGGDRVVEEYVFVGGVADGRRLALDNPASIMRVPVPQPVEIARKVIPFRESLTDHVQDYRRFGHRYWWDGLIEDATAAVDVSDEWLARGGSALRALIREQLRRYLEDLAPGKGLHRIIWRIKPADRMFTHRVEAYVGPRAVERGLYERAKRRPGIGQNQEAIAAEYARLAETPR